MHILRSLRIPAAVVALAALVVALPAQQPPANPNRPAGNQLFSVGNTANQPSNATYGTAYSSPYRSGFAVSPPPVPVYTPGWGFPGYGNFYSGAFGNSSMGYMMGASSLLNSFGQYANDIQQSRLTGQEVERSRIQTRRAKWDQWLYERATKPTENDERERTRMIELQRALGNPPESEIWSGQALNTLLENINRMRSPGMPSPFVPVDQDILSRLNVSGSGSEGNFGLLKNGGQLEWPFPLQAPTFDAYRTDISKLFQTAATEASLGPVRFATINDLEMKLSELDEEITRQTRTSEISATRSIQARRFLREMQASTRALQDPNVTQFAQKKWVARGNNVGEVLSEMTRNGLKFAPATRGDQPAYFAFHRSMVDYSNALLRMLGAQPVAANQPAYPGGNARP